MLFDFSQFGGMALAIAGASLAVGLSCVGSAYGTSRAGEAASGIIAADPSQFGKALVLQILPGTQGLYGLVVWFLAASNLGLLSGELRAIDLQTGWQYVFACLPMALGGLLSARLQGRVAASCMHVLAKQPDDWSKGILFCVMVEFYAILSLLVSFLMLRTI